MLEVLKEGCSVKKLRKFAMILMTIVDSIFGENIKKVIAFGEQST